MTPPTGGGAGAGAPLAGGAASTAISHAVYRDLVVRHTVEQAGPCVRTAGAQTELHGRYVDDSGEGPRLKRQLPLPGQFAFLPTTRIPKQHAMAGVGAYLRTANAAELLEIRPPAPVAAFMFGGALDAAPAAARNPVTTRDVASGEVLCELTGIELTYEEVLDVYDEPSDEQRKAIVGLPTDGVGKGGFRNPARCLVMVPHPACVAAAVPVAGRSCVPGCNAAEEHVLCGGCALRPQETTPHFHILLVASSNIPADTQVCAAPRIVAGRGDAARGCVDREDSDYGDDSGDDDGGGAAPRRSKPAVRRSSLPAPAASAQGGGAQGGDDDVAQLVAQPAARVRRQRPIVAIPGGCCQCDCGCTHAFSSDKHEWQVQSEAAPDAQPPAGAWFCNACYRHNMARVRLPAGDADAAKLCTRPKCAKGSCRFCKATAQAAGAAGAAAPAPERAAKRPALETPEGAAQRGMFYRAMPAAAAPMPAAPPLPPMLPVVPPVLPPPAPVLPPPAPVLASPPPPPAASPAPDLAAAMSMAAQAATAAQGNAATSPAVARLTAQLAAAAQALAAVVNEDNAYADEIADAKAAVAAAEARVQSAQPHGVAAARLRLQLARDMLDALEEARDQAGAAPPPPPGGAA